jgi:hypothetical protein
MPRRLAVVVSQSATASAVRRQLEESLITNLLLESGLDLNVVPNIPDLSSDQTGLLCLEGIQGPMVLVSWLSEVDAHQALAKKGIHARPGRTSFGSAATNGDTTAARVIYAIDLKGFDTPAPICAEIRRIRDDLATPTISILAAGSLPIHSVQPNPPTIAASPLPPTPAPAATAHDESVDDDDPALQRLVDMLDEMDL